jgi:hypothetical protein
MLVPFKQTNHVVTLAHVLCGELRRSAQFSTQYTPHTQKIHAATLPRCTDNLLKILSILMF